MGCSASKHEISSGIQKKMPEAKFHIDENENFYVALTAFIVEYFKNQCFMRMKMDNFINYQCFKFVQGLQFNFLVFNKTIYVQY